MCPCLPIRRDNTFEILEPKLLTVWDAEMITNILEDKKDIEILLASYFSDRMMLPFEFLDIDNALLPTVHAVVVVWNRSQSHWELLDSNQEVIKTLKDSRLLLKNAYSVKVFEWVMIHISNDPDRQWKNKLSYNHLWEKLGGTREKKADKKHTWSIKVNTKAHLFLEDLITAKIDYKYDK